MNKNGTRLTYTCINCHKSDDLIQSDVLSSMNVENIVDSFVVVKNSVLSSTLSQSNKNEKSDPLVKSLYDNKKLELEEIKTNICNHKISTKDAVPDNMCNECIEELIKSLNEEIEQLQREENLYVLEDMSIPFVDERQYKEKMRKLKEDEAKLTQTHFSLKVEANKRAKQRNTTENKINTFKSKEKNYWQVLMKQHDILNSTHADKLSNQRLLKHFDEEYKRLEHSNSTSWAHIWYEEFDGVKIGTINGLKLGRLPRQQTPWSEINAAWGLCSLLLLQMSMDEKVDFLMYRIIPMGQTSKMKDCESGKEYELYNQGPRHNILNFNTAMKYFLCCLSDYCKFIDKNKPSRDDVHYAIDEDLGTIGECSVEYRPDQETVWTKAMISMLIKLKQMRRKSITDRCCRSLKQEPEPVRIFPDFACLKELTMQK
ncbi:hypothetical protein AKO1_009613 [Acrasis kona]|uniref:Atg6 BARA domain-containing protein n=1 Tax=Acrasis kona TaxID=1008807 RepID=A0AAW2ZN52_9EUKA